MGDKLDDSCQEVFIKVYKNLSKCGSEVLFEHWASKIAVNVLYDMLLKQHRMEGEVLVESVAFSLRAPRNRKEMEQ
jgi:DNA-directed RNA polymerase specialized sigma24 family protein